MRETTVADADWRRADSMHSEVQRTEGEQTQSTANVGMSAKVEAWMLLSTTMRWRRGDGQDTADTVYGEY